MAYKEELINLIEPDFIFNKKPINRFKIAETNIKKYNLDKVEQITNLKKLINSIKNCNLKDNSKSLILGDGNPDSPIMIIGARPTIQISGRIIGHTPTERPIRDKMSTQRP